MIVFLLITIGFFALVAPVVYVYKLNNEERFLVIMIKAFNKSYFISKSIFIWGIILLVLLAVRHLLGIEYTTYGFMHVCAIEAPLDIPIILLGIVTCLFSFFYYPLLLLFMILFLIFRNKITTNETQVAIGVKRYFMFCLLTFLIGLIVLIMSSYMMDACFWD